MFSHIIKKTPLQLLCKCSHIHSKATICCAFAWERTEEVISEAQNYDLPKHVWFHLYFDGQILYRTSK